MYRSLRLDGWIGVRKYKGKVAIHNGVVYHWRLDLTEFECIVAFEGTWSIGGSGK